MKHFYLIDFENVSDAGLAGFFDLTEEDTAYLFYSQKANRISIDFFKTLLEHRSAAAIHFFKVAPGNQALDLQLASFLGSLLAENPGECDFCIISKDKGYAVLSSFWANRHGSSRLSQAASISEALARRARAAEPAARPVPAVKPEHAPEPVAEAPALPQAPSAETDEVPAPPALEPAPEPEAVPTSEPAPEAEKPAAEPVAEEPAPARPRAIRPARSFNGRGRSPEAAAKPAAEEAKPKSSPTPPNEKTILNAKVQQTLSKARYDTKIIAQAASMTSKCFGDPKIKQLVYRGLIKEHGQKMGLEIYNLIKPLL